MEVFESYENVHKSEKKAKGAICKMQPALEGVHLRKA